MYFDINMDKKENWNDLVSIIECKPFFHSYITSYIKVNRKY